MEHRMGLLGLKVHTSLATPGRDLGGGAPTSVRMLTLCAAPSSTGRVRDRDYVRALGRRVLILRQRAVPFFGKKRHPPTVVGTIH
jgi:hypothetical protein